jgi:hypothetical protein
MSGIVDGIGTPVSGIVAIDTRTTGPFSVMYETTTAGDILYVVQSGVLGAKRIPATTIVAAATHPGIVNCPHGLVVMPTAGALLAVEQYGILTSSHGRLPPRATTPGAFDAVIQFGTIV